MSGSRVRPKLPGDHLPGEVAISGRIPRGLLMKANSWGVFKCTVSRVDLVKVCSTPTWHVYDRRFFLPPPQPCIRKSRRCWVFLILGCEAGCWWRFGSTPTPSLLGCGLYRNVPPPARPSSWCAPPWFRGWMPGFEGRSSFGSDHTSFPQLWPVFERDFLPSPPPLRQRPSSLCPHHGSLCPRHGSPPPALDAWRVQQVEPAVRQAAPRPLPRRPGRQGPPPCGP